VKLPSVELRKQLVRGALLVVSWRLLTFFYAWVGMQWIPLRFISHALNHEYGKIFPYWIGIWSNFDGVHYLTIAHRGYLSSTQPFFPLFPLAIRLVHHLTDFEFLTSGLLVAHLAFIASLFVVWKLLKIDGWQKPWLFFILLMLFPTAYSYGAVYNDALFFLLACLCLYAGRRRNWVLAGCFGALATLTRLNGLVLGIFLAVEYLTAQTHSVAETWQFSAAKKWLQQLQPQRVLRSGILAAAAIPGAFLGYLAYIDARFGDWHLLFSVMAIWNQQKTTLPIQVFWRYLKILSFASWRTSEYWVAVIEFCFALTYILAIFYGWRRVRLSYWLFMTASFAVPAMTGTFAGMPRYALHLYPFFLLMSEYIITMPRGVRWFLVFLMMFFGCVIVSLFTRGYFVT
jgi:hypothetical protein